MKIKAGKMLIEIDESGYVTSMFLNKEYLYARTPLIRIVIDNEVLEPISFSQNGEKYIIGFNNSTVEMLITEKDSHVKLVIEEIDDKVSCLLWGVYPLTIKDTIGEVVGVCRDNENAIGFQGLNAKTMEGYPIEIKPMVFNSIDTSQVVDTSLTRYNYNMCAAFPTHFGSILQSYCRNYSDTMINGDPVIKGSSIALFGCSAKDALDVISTIELEEHLPHPMINGKWGKITREALISYLIVEFSKDNFDEILDYVEKGGFKSVYHGEPFKNWGHFELRDEMFPNGDNDLKECVEKAEKRDIIVGLHTLSNFTTTNDPYVTPIPDKRLVRASTALLTKDINDEETNIHIDNGVEFEDIGYLGAVVIDDEIIQYLGVVEENGTFIMEECVRGAFGTNKSAHKAGAKAEKLKDHGYKVVFPNNELQDEFSDRLVTLFNDTGIKQISFDGLEGCFAAGFENYGLARLVENCYNGWKNEIINDASSLSHFLWHIHTRMNWGEPWGAAMREGQVRARMVNQKFFERNLFPKMLGWFLLRTATKKFEASMLDDVEWALSKAAGFESGFAMCIEYPVMKNLGNIDSLLGAIKIWEEARMKGVFPCELREKLCDPKSEWHIEKKDDKFYLYPVAVSEIFVCDPNELQPGQPGGSDWTYNNPYAKQTAKFRLRVTETYGSGGFIENVGFYINGRNFIIRDKIEAGQYLIYNGGTTADICDSNLNILKTVKGGVKELELISGDQAIAFTCDFNYVAQPEIQVKFMVHDEPIILG